jgi:hypothetical protein
MNDARHRRPNVATIIIVTNKLGSRELLAAQHCLKALFHQLLAHAIFLLICDPSMPTVAILSSSDRRLTPAHPLCLAAQKSGMSATGMW